MSLFCSGVPVSDDQPCAPPVPTVPFPQVEQGRARVLLERKNAIGHAHASHGESIPQTLKVYALMGTLASSTTPFGTLSDLSAGFSFNAALLPAIAIATSKAF